MRHWSITRIFLALFLAGFECVQDADAKRVDEAYANRNVVVYVLTVDVPAGGTITPDVLVKRRVQRWMPEGTLHSIPPLMNRKIRGNIYAGQIICEQDLEPEPDSYLDKEKDKKLAAYLVENPGILKGVDEMLQSQIEGNVPQNPQKFDEFLRRDLNSYFAERHKTSVKAEYELLRKNASQVGVSFPKFYAWVTVKDTKTGMLVDQGVVRIAAMGQTDFDITDFVSAKQISANPIMIYGVIPESLVAGAVARARGLTK